jgi:hypothetical protein
LYRSARGHHLFTQQWANEFRDLISENALDVLSRLTIGEHIIWEGDHPNKWGPEHKAYNDVGGRKIVVDFFAEKGITSTNKLDVQQSYELVDRLKQHDFNFKMQQYIDIQQSRGRINLNRMFRPRGGFGQPGD